MKRLKFFLLSQEAADNSYSQMYEGIMTLPTIPPTYHYDPTYWNNDIAYTITRTNKNALDKPVVEINIPLDQLGIEEATPAGADFILRAFILYIEELNAEIYNRTRPDHENGKYYTHIPGGKVFIRNSCRFADMPVKYYENKSGCNIRINDDLASPDSKCVRIMLQIQLPRHKHKKACEMLTRNLPQAVSRFLAYFNSDEYTKAVELEVLQNNIREALSHNNFCAFIANGSILPREKQSDKPLCGALPFYAPFGCESEICGIRGFGIKKGVTVITGGGYSGKSTMLDALSAGVYNHIAGDGRELVITDGSAVKITAEDGRAVTNVDISAFINRIPGGDPEFFTTTHASGSTSQAANIIEAVCGGSNLLLIDEDKSATNFMIRDRIMRKLVINEPIIPFTERVRSLYTDAGISTVLVIGGSSEYLNKADNIYMMDDFVLSNITETAHSVSGIDTAVDLSIPWNFKHRRVANGFTSYPRGATTEISGISDLGFIFFGDEKIDIRMLHEVASQSQINAMSYMLRYIARSLPSPAFDVYETVRGLYNLLKTNGLDMVYTTFFQNECRFMDLPREIDFISLINRMRFIIYD